ncbi:MAG: LamG domain-containing protein [Candidatus Pacearchaeota archaeon]|nr:LamG domain-containing protein [Candidatus Pacearchaeota archaeon]
MNKEFLAIFVLIFLFLVAIVTASTFIDNSQSNFDSGTYNWTFYNSSGFVQLNESRLNGTYTSQIFNSGRSSQWNNISWFTEVPYNQELPNNQEVETGDFLRGINMTGNVLLMHMNNDSFYGENDTHVYDFSGNGNNGTGIGFDGDEVTGYGKLNGAFDFDGTDDYVDVGTTILPANGDLTLSMWQQTRSSAIAHTALFGQNEDIFILYGVTTFGLANNQLRLFVDGEVCVGSDLRDDAWHLITVVRSGNNWIVYKDGTEDCSGIKASDPGIGDSFIGRRVTAADMVHDGLIDEVAIFNRSLSATEIQDIYKRGALRLNLSAQSCDDASCSGESFTNLGNNLTSPQNLSVTDNQYFQYKFDFTTDNASYTPELYNVTVDYTILNSAPTTTLNSPSNNSYQNDISSILLNATVNDLDLNNMTVWFYGGYPNGTFSIINTTYNQTNGTSVTYNWTGLSALGQYNWTVIANDGTANSTNEYFFFNLINLTVNCEAGGGYQQGALVLVQGNVTDGTSALNSQSVNLTVYDASNNLDGSANLTSADDGSFETTF